MKKLLIIALLMLSSCSTMQVGYVGYRAPRVNSNPWMYRPYMGNVYSDWYSYYNRRPVIVIYNNDKTPKVTPRNYSAQPNRGRSNQNRLRTPNKN